MTKKAIIIGAGPAGLTAAYELLKRTDIIPIILEKSEYIGGISKTINYKGNRMDMGPHRFFSKSDRVMEWWLKMMPLEEGASEDIKISYQNKTRKINQGDPAGQDATTPGQKDPDKVMLVIQRLTRIYFLRKFFAYPIQLGFDTLRTLGIIRTFKILISFLWIRLFPRKPEVSLEDFIINKFGKQLYLLFFKDYTEKVWGVPCHEISAEWGAQRIKGVSLSKAILQALKSLRQKKNGKADLEQKGTETSLIEQFLYPKHGPGSLWEEVAKQVQEMGGKIYMSQEVTHIYSEEGRITTVNTISSQTGQAGAWEGDYFFSTMPVKELIAGMQDAVPSAVQEVAAGLQYRDFINVGILLRQLSGPATKPGEYEKLDLKDNWIYIQERDVRVGRLMIYNNWGGGMIKDPNTTWIGMEYFCNKTDEVWTLDDETIQGMAIMELEKMGLARVDDVLDATVRRMEKTYPAYFGTYARFDEIRSFTDQFENLFLVGRNGMHKYNNADHSMLCSMVAVDNIVAGVTNKENLWSINTEQEYHEEKNEKKGKEIHLTKKGPKSNPTPSFKDFLIKAPFNKAYLVLAFISLITQFTIFKNLFPHANYIPDSYSYLTAAATNLDVNTWPVAYSKFLRIFSSFSHLDVSLVLLQYLLIELSCLYFLFSILYFYAPAKSLKNILYLFFILNPIPLFVSNFITADALFIAISFIWLTQLIWLINKPKPYHLFVQGILLLSLFTLRYNSIYYPLIAAIAILQSPQTWVKKIVGLSFSAVLILSSILITTTKMYQATGTQQFSPFGGWQLANNALYMYGHINPNKKEKVPTKFARLEIMARQHFDTTKVKNLTDTTLDGIYYLWSGKAPLIQYMDSQFKKDSTSSYFKKWASVGPLYAQYSLFLIKKYPIQFAQYFIWPNMIRYIMPPSEFLALYNMNSDSVGILAKNWFSYKSQSVKTKYKGLPGQVFSIMPTFCLIVNFLFLIGFSWYILIHRKLLDSNKSFSKAVLLTASLWLSNFLFSVLASPVVLRYQIFPIFVYLTFSLILIDIVDKHEKIRKHALSIKNNI